MSHPSAFLVSACGNGRFYDLGGLVQLWKGLGFLGSFQWYFDHVTGRISQCPIGPLRSSLAAVCGQP